MTQGNDRDVESFQRYALLLFLCVISAAFLYVTRIMLMPVLLAAIFAGLTYPLYQWFLKRIPNVPAIASLLTLITVVSVTVLPLGIMGTIAYHQAAHFLQHLDMPALQARTIDLAAQLKDKFPALFGDLDPQEAVSDAVHWVQSWLQGFLRYATSFSLGLIERVLGLFVSLFCMFYFYLEGRRLLGQLIKWSPLKDEYDEILIANFISVTKGTLKAAVVIGLINGSLAGFTFWIVGLGSPVFLGSLIFIGTFIPVIGGGPIWVPATLYLMLHGRWAGAITVLIMCGGVLHAIHSVLLPVLIGKDAKMHNVLTLMSTLGGIFVFGFIGVIIGPILGALFLSIWKIYAQVFAREISHNRRR